MDSEKDKKIGKLRRMQREYIKRLLADPGVEDKMPLFIRAKRIFGMVLKKKKLKKEI